MSEQNIMVVADVHHGAVTNITLELLGAARTLASFGQGQVVCVVMGPDAQELACKLTAADRVIALQSDQPVDCSPEDGLAEIEQLVDQHHVRAVLIGSTAAGLDLGPMLAARNGWPLVGNCIDCALLGEQLQVTASTMGGKLLADLTIDASPAVLLALPGQFPAVEPTGDGQVSVQSLEARPDGRITFEAMLFPDEGDVDISKESMLIAVGRGIGQEDNMEVAEELADALHGQLCASRPVVDQGWLPATRQVGKSGMVVKPKCYLALGVSGAPEHVEGMADADLIIAVNTDPQAPIFEVAHFGIVDDLLDVAEAMTESLKSRVSG